MALLLGIDTGGTYTDCVVLDEVEGIVASSKALTTRHDLAIGIGSAVDNVLAASKADPSQIALVSLSTTLATNALVEGQGGRVCLVLIGFDESALKRAGLAEALKGDPHIIIEGGHNAFGGEQAPLDKDGLDQALNSMDGEVSAFAVAGQFAVRNQTHENTVRDLLVEKTGKPVTCSHELSQRLDGPRRALTCVLNARLINLIHHLISAASSHFETRGINAPLMVVRGDGALISAEFAKYKPIETILSGPAASLVGAAWLSGEKDALVSDIGGTTTDYAFLRDGKPRLDPQGAKVGGWQTMVEAVAMRTIGLGGDSQVHVVEDGLKSRLVLGPRRHVPLSLLAQDVGELVHDTLGRQLKAPRVEEFDGLFAFAVGRTTAYEGSLGDGERKLLDMLDSGVMPVAGLLKARTLISALDRLVSRGLVMISGVTPSDASHVLGRHDAWDTEAARKGLSLLARRKNNAGLAIADNAEAMAQWILDTLTRQSSQALLEAALQEEGIDRDTLATFLLDEAGRTRSSIVNLDYKVNLPVTGLGASAHIYYPAVAEALNTSAIVPTHADVANAVGAVVGRVSVSLEARIEQPEEGKFKIFSSAFANPPRSFTNFNKAIEFARSTLEEETRAQAHAAGAGEIEFTESREEKTSTIEGQSVVIEARLVLTASGRPRITG
ncbi:MAG: hydantoinase/oxoprolinase N-terminal domain-containing protein [Hyphomicrobiales bacterium]